MTTEAAGFPRVTAAIEALAAQSTNVLKLHAGDATTGTLYFNRAGADGEADAAMMNTVCFDAFTLGNHEFDKGDTGLKNFLGFLPAARRLDIGVLDADVFQAYIDRQPKDAATGLPRLTKLATELYSTKSHVQP